jgi:hypothetical protein
MFSKNRNDMFVFILLKYRIHTNNSIKLGTCVISTNDRWRGSLHNGISDFSYLIQLLIIIIILIIIFTSMMIMSRDPIIIIYHLQLLQRHSPVTYGTYMSKFTALTYCIVFKFYFQTFSELVTSELKLVTITVSLYTMYVL